MVVGAGHAGCEAAAAAARLGLDVVVVTLDLGAVGRLSCNPAIGGLAKGHLVRELDALGGLMARAADRSCVQFRQLNTSRGLAVRSSRAQVDVHAYPEALWDQLRHVPSLRWVQGQVRAVEVHGTTVTGVVVDDVRIETPRVILTTGTFLRAVMHRGEEQTSGGRRGEPAAADLSVSLTRLGLTLTRLKTGTVPRLDRRTIDWDAVPAQDDVVPQGRLSFTQVPRELPPIQVHVTATNERVHELVRSGLDRSPLWTGAITGTGPRYCPCIEDKVVRFADRTQHLLFLEPEGHRTHQVYLGGLSTSLPVDLQERVVRALPGLAHAEILHPGYAVEYDVGDPRSLDAGLQHRELRGLWLAGQVNGTSGYEEAAVQGFVAGVSAARGEPLRIGRHESYVGVLVDDLVTKGTGGEPYRMFTSRAEHRLLLREDNADRRLMPTGRELGLVADADWEAFTLRQSAREEAVARLDLGLGTGAQVAQGFREAGLEAPHRVLTRREVLRRPEVTYAQLRIIDPALPPLDDDTAESLEVDVKYEGYVAQATRRAETAARLEARVLPSKVDWSRVASLTTEVRERLTRAQPQTLGQVGRLPGVTPAAVGAIVAWLTSGTEGSRPGPAEP